MLRQRHNGRNNGISQNRISGYPHLLLAVIAGAFPAVHVFARGESDLQLTANLANTSLLRS